MAWTFTVRAASGRARARWNQRFQLLCHYVLLGKPTVASVYRGMPQLILQKIYQTVEGYKDFTYFQTLVAKGLCSGFERESSGEKQTISGSNIWKWILIENCKNELQEIKMHHYFRFVKRKSNHVFHERLMIKEFGIKKDIPHSKHLYQHHYQKHKAKVKKKHSQAMKWRSWLWNCISGQHVNFFFSLSIVWSVKTCRFQVPSLWMPTALTHRQLVVEKAVHVWLSYCRKMRFTEEFANSFSVDKLITLILTNNSHTHFF